VILHLINKKFMLMLILIFENKIKFEVLILENEIKFHQYNMD